MNRETFVWGAATSAHQVEGNNIHSDWWAWEKSDDRERSGRAANQYECFVDDFALAKTLGHTAHRLSIEWSRIEPMAGQWSMRAVEHYRAVLLALRAQGLTSFVTLHHFTNPQWFVDKGGWESQETAARFAAYVAFVATHLGDLVDFWITINEPIVWAEQSYLEGRWPPQVKSYLRFRRVVRHLARAHSVAYQEIHRRIPTAEVGIAQHMIAWRAASRQRWLDRIVAELYSWWFNHDFFRLTSGTHDFIGVNYYFTSTKHVQLWPPKIVTTVGVGLVSDLGWPIDATGLTQVLLEARRYKKPIYITENGVADASDDKRSDFLRDHIRAVEKAQAAGADVRGYFHWSLLDNFEWDLGFAPRFGLVAVDFTTQKRTPRPSAYVFKAIITQAAGLKT